MGLLIHLLEESVCKVTIVAHKPHMASCRSASSAAKRLQARKHPAEMKFCCEHQPGFV